MAAVDSADKQRLGWLGGLTGVAALGAVAAGGAARNIARSRALKIDDPYADVDFTEIYTDEAETVLADDGVALAVRSVYLGDDDPGDGVGRRWSKPTEPEVTVVFVHGFSLRMASWHFQRYQLARRWAGRRIRLVFFDHRGHGNSESAPAETCTIAQIADDTATVIAATAPRGPVVLVGHSMGGMALLGMARRHPQMFGPNGQIAGAALVATAARGLTEAGLGEGLSSPIVDLFRLSVRRIPGLVKAGRGITRAAFEPVLLAASFGPDFYSPNVGRAVEKMIQNTPLPTVVNFLHALEMHDESTALGILAEVPTVVICGDADRMTPLPNSVRMYSELGDDSELIVVERAGHMVQMERPMTVTDAIDELVSRSRINRGHPRGWRKLMSRRSVVQ